MLTWDQSVSYEVAELLAENGSSDGDWMARVLQNEAFHRIPPANIQAMFLRMEPVHFSAGDTVVRQGEDGDYFYTIKQGRCQVIRETARHPHGVVLAKLGAGDSFGEEALVSDTRRNATVRMATDGVLMRLAKSDFLKLLKEPLLRRIGYQRATAKTAEGAIWLDVRLPSEYEKRRIPNSINIPLYFLRSRLRELRTDATYIICCDTGRRSAAAAYLLSARGLDALVLDGGLARARIAA
jgi:CRP-like cAMP-binding protein